MPAHMPHARLSHQASRTLVVSILLYSHVSEKLNRATFLTHEGNDSITIPPFPNAIGVTQLNEGPSTASPQEPSLPLAATLWALVNIAHRELTCLP